MVCVQWDDDIIPYFVEKLCAYCMLAPDTGDELFFERRARNWQARPHELVDQDWRAANKFAARISEEQWDRIQASPEIAHSLALLPENADLFDMRAAIWGEMTETLANLLDAFLTIDGVGAAKATKLLYLKRPNVIPICDSIAMERLLGLTRTVKDSGTVIRCIDVFRQIGSEPENRRVLEVARQHLNNVLPEGDAYRDMPLVKVLDSVIWFDTEAHRKYYGLFGWE